MKRILLAVCLMFGGASLVVAQEQPQTPSPTQTQPAQDQEGQQISVSELPDAVTAKLESQDFSGWTVGTAYKKMDENNQEMYVVELKQGTETKKVKFDRDGNELEKAKHEKSENYRDAETDQATPPDQSETDQSATDESAPDQSTQSEQSTTDQADNSSTETEQQ